MGITKSTLSYDFCSIVRNQLLQTDVDFNDHETWKTIFTTEMSDREIIMYLNSNSVRLMRRNKPHNLANLAYRCMQQLIAFLDKATLPGATVVHRPNNNNNNSKTTSSTAAQGETSPAVAPAAAAAATSEEATLGSAAQLSSLAALDSFVDACAAQNALRILIQVLPVVYETTIVVEQSIRPSFTDDEDDVNPTSLAQKGTDELIDKLLKVPQSPFALPFAQCFFGQNLRCDARAPRTAFPPLFAENALRAQESGWDKSNAGDEGGLLPVPLGQELIVVLTRLCFVPGFSVEYGAVSTSAMRYLRGISTENATCGHDIVEELLGLEGLFWNAAEKKAAATAKKEEENVKVVAPGGEDNKSSSSSGEAPAAAAGASSITAVGTRVFNTVFSFDVLQNRLQLLRCLMCALSKSAITGKPIAESDLLRTCFVDIARNPLSLTLVVSCLGYICTYESRGAMPYSSHYFADVPELMLSRCMEFISIVLAFPPDCCSVDDAGVAAEATAAEGGEKKGIRGAYPPSTFERFVAAASRNHHSLWLALVKLLTEEPKAAPAIVCGLCTVLNNPVYAASTSLRGSQKVIETAHEAVGLLWMLCFSPGTQAAVLPVLASACCDSVDEPALFGGAYVIMGLLRVVLRGLEERRHVGHSQAALWLLFLLSAGANERFVSCLSKTLAAGMCPLPSLENLNKAKQGSVTLGDALVLALCEMCCPSAPRWLIPVTELTTAILANTVPRLPRLMEITQFELFHLLEWVTGAFLSVQRSSVNQDSCLLAVVDMYVGAATAHPFEYKPLVASLATEVKVSDRLKHFAEMQPRDPSVKPEPPRIDADMAAKFAPTFTPTPAVRAGLPLAAFVELERVAVEKMNEEHTAGGGHHSKNDADPYSALDSAIPYFPSSGEDDDDVKLRSTQPSMELLRWGICQSWAMAVQANAASPLFDVHKAGMFN